MFRSFVLGLLLGLAISGAVLYLIVRDGSRKLDEAKGTIISLAESNRRLQDDYSRIELEARNLDERLGNRQRVINEIAGAVEGLGTGIGESADLVSDIIRTVERIEYLLHN